jgi:hypothetical protein
MNVFEMYQPHRDKSLVIASLFKDKNTNSSRPVFIRIQLEKELKVILEKKRKAAN